MNLNKANRAFKDIQSVLTCPWWLEFGGALGKYRRGKFMSYDSDIDIGVRAEDWFANDFAKDLANCKDWEKNSKFVWSGNWIKTYVGDIKGNDSKVRFKGYGVPVVIHVWYSGVGQYGSRRFVLRKKKQLTWCEERFTLPDENNMPLYTEEYFDWYFGANWKVPNKDWKGSKQHRIVQANRHINPKTILTCGVFDILHEGHINILRRASKYGYLVVGVQEDEYVTHVKTKAHPIRTFQERYAQIQALDIADKIIPYRSGVDGLIVKEVKPDILIHGDDWHEQADRTKVLSVLEEVGGEIILLPRTPDVSSTGLRSRI